ncbi:MAG: dTMP kinase [Bacteroidales bacterium]|nr:dTMP kinase [Bacteroidales bacterium]
MLIVLEGLDGAGKSTQLKAMEDYFKAGNKSVHFLHFPQYDTPVYGTLVARFLRGESGSLEGVDPYLVALLFAGNRYEKSRQLKKWLEQEKIVILDRYVYSNVAFQCAKVKDLQERERLRTFILNMEFEHFGIPRPDINLFLDVPLDFVKKNLHAAREGEDRFYLEGKEDIHEASVVFQQEVREVYLKQAAQDRSFKIISCVNEAGTMAGWQEIFERIKPYLP